MPVMLSALSGKVMIFHAKESRNAQRLKERRGLHNKTITKYFGHLIWRGDLLEKTLMLGGLPG